MRPPQGWADPDGVVRVVGMRCEAYEDPEGGPTCPGAPLLMLYVDTDDVTSRDLGVTTSSDIAFSAVAGDADALVVAYVNAPPDEDVDRGFRAYRLEPTGARVTELGPVGLVVPCPSGDGFTLYPQGLGGTVHDPLVVHEVRGDALHTIGEVSRLEEDVAQVTACSPEGHAIVEVAGAFGVERRTLTVAGGEVGWEADEGRPEPPPGAAVQPLGDRAIAWAPGDSDEETTEWTLHEWRDDAWVELGRLRSLDTPMMTTFSGGHVVAITTVEQGATLELVR